MALLVVLSAVSSHGAAMDVTAIIKTFERPACLERLLRSIHEHLPEMAVVVVNDGRNAEKELVDAQNKGLLDLAGGVDYVAADYDIGISAGRNLALSKVQSEFALLLDDDFVVTNETNVDRLVEVVKGGGADIAGGELYVIPQDLNMGLLDDLIMEKQRRVVVSAAFMLGIDKNAKMLITKVSKVDQDTCSRTDMISNFFVARTKTLQELKWDANLKLNEAEDFFLRAGMQGLTVQYCPVVKAMHDGQCTLAPGHDHEAYKLKRERGLYYYQALFQKYDLSQFSSGFGGVYLKTCAFKEQCVVAHMWKKDELKTCDDKGECETHKVALKKHQRGHMQMFKCDASGDKCDQAVTD